MDDRQFKKLLLPSFLIVVLSSVFVYELKIVVDQLFFKKKHILLIGILSAPENFQQRSSIRKTWLNLLTEISGSSYFIVGNEVCNVPPYDRADPYSCTYRPFLLPRNITPQTEFTTMEIHRENSGLEASVPGFIGFGFYVRSSIVITKLGILRKLLLVINADLQVKLVSAFDNKVLASVTFNSDLLKESTSEALTKAIKPIKLNANFEAFVKLEAKNLDNMVFPSCDFTTWQSKPYVINFIQLWEQDSVMPVSFIKKSCTFVFINYNILDVENIKRNMSKRTIRLREWQRLNRKLSFKLQNESKVFNDILFVDVIDTYRNLSLKMIQFYKRIWETEYFHYVLKADDDSFIDLLRVNHQLSEASKQIDEEISSIESRIKEPGIITKLRLSKFWWWSFFKEFWRVERSGKWRELHYRSASYPTFPCGGGYVVNKGIVDYIATNEHNLHCFQGEDVSLGIWLSSLPVIQYKTPRVISESPSYNLQKKIKRKFRGKNHKMNKTLNYIGSDLCDWTCSKKRYYNRPLCNKVQLSVENMYEAWTEFINKGFL